MRSTQVQPYLRAARAYGTARAALAGFTLHLIAVDAGRSAFLLSKWNLMRELPDLAEVCAFLDQVGPRR